MLGIAAQMMNRDGAASVTPAAIAQATGMTRNALYYYYRDKESLLCSCYQAAATHLSSAVDMALRVRGSAREQLIEFMRCLMAPEQAQAILHDLDLLPAAEATRIREQQQTSLQRLTALFARGIDEGDFRNVCPEVAAHVLLGMADWARLWRTWSLPPGDEAVRAGCAGDDGDVILHCLLYGFSATGAPPMPPPDVVGLIQASGSVLDRRSLAEQKRLALLGVASQLFNRRGIAATAIDDIAAAADATKGLVYHHFASKAELVDACYDRAFDLYERFAEVAENAAGTGSLESLTWPTHLCAQALRSGMPPLMLQSGVSALPARHRRRAMALAERFNSDMSQAIERGIAHPYVMPLTELSAGAFFWIPRWHAEVEGIGAYALADQIVDLLTNGVVSRG